MRVVLRKHLLLVLIAGLLFAFIFIDSYRNQWFQIVSDCFDSNDRRFEEIIPLRFDSIKDPDGIAELACRSLWFSRVLSMLGFDAAASRFHSVFVVSLESLSSQPPEIRYKAAKIIKFWTGPDGGDRVYVEEMALKPTKARYDVVREKP